MSERNIIQQTFDEFGREARFEKKSGSWYGRSEEVIAVSNLQKSQYGSRYFINQGFWLIHVDDERYPKPNKLHIQARLGALLPTKESRIDELLDLEYEMTDDQRRRELQTLLTDELLPLVKRGSTVEGLRAMVADGTFRRAGIGGPAQPLLTQVAP